MTEIKVKDKTLYLYGEIVIANITNLLKDYDRNYAKSQIKKLDLSQVKEIDGAGVSLIETILDRQQLANDALIAGDKSIMKTIEIFSRVKG